MFDPFDGEPDDVVVVALDLFDEGAADLLDGVAAGLVQILVAVEIGGDGGRVKSFEGDVGDLEADDGPVLGGVEEGDAGDDPVFPAGETAEHGLGGGPVGRLAEDLRAQADDGVGADDQRIRVFIGHVAGLGLCRGHGEADRIGLGDSRFVHSAGNDPENGEEARQKLPSARRL